MQSPTSVQRMLKSTTRCLHITLCHLLCLLGLLIFASAAQSRDTPRAPQQDPAIEAQLDAYLTLQLTDPDAASAQLNDLLATLNATTPTETHLRALTYRLFYLLYKPDPVGVDSLLAQLQHVKQQPLSANAQAELLAAELEVHMFRNALNQAYVDAEHLIPLLADVDNPRVRFWVNSLLARLFRADNQFEKALRHYELALDAIASNQDERTLIRRAYLNQQRALVYADMKNWASARTLLETLYQEAEQQGLDYFLADINLSLGVVLAEQRDFAAAEANILKGLARANSQKQHDLVRTFMNNLGAVYIEQQKYHEATRVLQDALTAAEASHDQDNIQIIRFNLGYLQVRKGDAEAGLAQMHDAFAYYQKKQNKAEIAGFLRFFAKAYTALGDTAKLAEVLQWQLQLQEDIMTAERNQATKDLMARYDLKSQNQQITILQQQNDLQKQQLSNKHLQQRVTLLGAGLLLCVGLLLIMLYRNVRKTNKRLKEVNKQLEYQSQCDPLTGLLNRRAFQEKMAARARAPTADALGLLILDIDFFKQINDNYGHAAGDAVLVAISHELQQQFKKSDLVIRWGGEEFLIVIRAPQHRQIAALCQNLLQRVSQLRITFEQHTLAVTVSGGYLCLPFSGVPETTFNWEKTLQVADMALYLSKMNGRNQINIIDGLLVPFAQAEPYLQSDLNGAIQATMLKIDTVRGESA